MPTFPYPETFTVVSRTVSGVDGLGNPTYTPGETTVTGAFAPEGSTELTQGQDTVLDRDTVYLTDGSPTPGPGDRIRVRGVLFEIDGRPVQFHNPFTGAEPGAVLRLLRVTG